MSDVIPLWANGAHACDAPDTSNIDTLDERPVQAKENAPEEIIPYKDYLLRNIDYANEKMVDFKMYYAHGTDYVDKNSPRIRVGFCVPALEAVTLYQFNENGSFFKTLKYADGEQAPRYAVGGGYLDLIIDEDGHIYRDLELTPIFCKEIDINDESKWVKGQTIKLKEPSETGLRFDILYAEAMRRAKKCACWYRNEEPPVWATKPYYIREFINVQALGYNPEVVKMGMRLGHVDPNWPIERMTKSESIMIHDMYDKMSDRAR